MRLLKGLLAGFILLMCCGWVGPWDEWDTMSGPAVHTSTLGKLQAIGGLTFYKDYTTGSTDLDADYAAGDDTATFTRSNVACTYVDAAGVVQTVSTANVPRIGYADYSSAGLVSLTPGLIVEASVKNNCPYSYSYEDATWDKTNVTADDASATAPDGTSNASTLTASDANGTVLLHTAVTARTYSVWLKRKTGTGAISITADSGSNYTAVTLTTGWTRHQVTAASASQTCGIKIATNGDAVYAWVSQFETGPYMTSTIINATTALTRGAEVLKYPILNNRTAAQETIIIKFTPLGGGFANDGTYRFLSSTLTKNRSFRKGNTSTVLTFYPNVNDSGGCYTANTTTPLVNTAYVIGAVAYGETAAINAEIYVNGLTEGTPDTDNYTAPVWGANYFIGCGANSLDQFNGLIHKVAFFNRPLSASEVLAASNLMQ